MSHILTTLYSFILSNPLGHQAPYLVYICHLATHRCGWLSFGIICQSIKIFDKRFNFFESVIFTLVSILDIAIVSPPLQTNIRILVSSHILPPHTAFSINLCITPGHKTEKKGNDISAPTWCSLSASLCSWILHQSAIVLYCQSLVYHPLHESQ